MSYSKKDLLRKAKRLVKSVYPNGKLILFGSQARGDAREESDWDILVLLDKEEIDESDFDNITYPLIELGWTMGQQISPKLYTNKEWIKRSFTPFYKNVEQEGITI